MDVFFLIFGLVLLVINSALFAKFLDLGASVIAPLIGIAASSFLVTISLIELL